MVTKPHLCRCWTAQVYSRTFKATLPLTAHSSALSCKKQACLTSHQAGSCETNLMSLISFPDNQFHSYQVSLWVYRCILTTAVSRSSCRDIEHRLPPVFMASKFIILPFKALMIFNESTIVNHYGSVPSDRPCRFLMDTSPSIMMS